MLEISEEALKQLVEYKKRRGPDSLVRIGILSGSTTGPSLGVSVDEKKDNDAEFDYDDLKVIIDRPLLEFCQKITVEYVLQEGGGCSSGGGFKLTAENPV